MVSQATTYTRRSFSANPMRTFALVLAFNQEENTPRLFHHGDLTASGECDITEQDDLKEVVRLFLTLASWGMAEEAGVFTCYSDTIYLLPEDQEGTSHVSAEVEDILSWYLCIRGVRREGIDKPRPRRGWLCTTYRLQRRTWVTVSSPR